MNKKILYILLLGLILRIILLNQSFWLDEAISAITASKPFPSQWADIFGDFQPPLYYLLLHFYMLIPIRSEWFLRLPSVFFGLLTIPLLYKFAKDQFDEKTALISALLLAISQFHIFYSQELRMYSLLCFLSLASMWLFFKKKWFFLTAVNVVGLYISYMYVLIFLPQLVWMVYKFWANKELIFKWMLSVLIAGIIFAPWIPNFARQLTNGKNLIIELPAWKNISSPPFWKLAPQIFLKFTLGRINFDNKYFYGGIFISFIIFYGYLLSSLKNKIDDRVLFVLNWFTTPLVASILISFFIPIAGVWRLIFLLPPFLILLAFSISQLAFSKHILSVLIAINLFSNVLYFIFPRYQRENWRGAVSYLEENNDPVIFTAENGFAPYLWYRSKEKLICGPIGLENCLTGTGVFYVTYLQPLFDTAGSIEKNLKEKGFKSKEVRDFPGVGFVYLYENSH